MLYSKRRKNKIILNTVILGAICFSSLGSIAINAFESDIQIPSVEENASLFQIDFGSIINKKEDELQRILLYKKEIENKVIYDEVPLIYQTDFPEVPYHDGTIADSGCGITCMSMVGTYLNNIQYSPANLGPAVDHTSDNLTIKMENAGRELGLTWTKTEEWSETVNALKNGQVVIILVDYRCNFTDGGHFIVLTGITEDGRIMVNDPNGHNYEKEGHCEGYKTGFLQEEITCGYLRSWIFPKKDINKAETLAKLEQLEKEAIQELLKHN